MTTTVEMAKNAVLETAKGAVKDRLDPVVESIQGRVDETVRGTRRAVTRARHAVEDTTADAVLRVRRRPLESVAAAAAAGVLAGCALGFLLGWGASRRKSD